jgi:hypothetical protein
MRCPNCDFVLKSGACPGCGQDNVLEAKFCNWCGQPLEPPKPQPLGEEEVLQERVACSDGMCVGIIGPDGLCVVCGRKYSGPPDLSE